MIEKLFMLLNDAVQGSPLLAIGGSFLWGILSIILSPCHLSSIPLIVGFVDEQGRISTKRAFAVSTLFAVGILVSIALVGLITSTAGRMMGDVGAYGNYLVAGVFFLVGLHLIGLIPTPWSGPSNIRMQRKGLMAAFVLGLVFGIALGPCTFAYMAPILSITFSLAGVSILYGFLLLLMYGIGHCSVIVLAGTFTEVVQHYLNWNERSAGVTVVKVVCGILVILGGIYMVYKT
ncbi:MAG TPA: cytochrome C biogenesis protein [Deltaproteobacteria bacterium]|nr:cytochrome C biogenesis protein [Deltaproteobacteria bacterium]